MGYTVILLALIVFAANVVETVLGFGNTLLAVALAGTFLPIDFLLPALVPVNLALSLYIVIRHRRHVQWTALGTRVLPLILLGLSAGLAVFTLAENRALRLGYGAFVLAYALWGLVGWFRARTLGRKAMASVAADPPPDEVPESSTPAATPNPSPLPVFSGPQGSATLLRRLSLLQGAALVLGSGFFQGLYAAGGPMLVAYADREFETKGSFRATLSAVWALLGTIMVTVYGLTDKLTAKTLATSAWLVPILVLAIFAGEWLHARASRPAFRLAVLTLLLVAGLSFLF